MTQDVAIGWEDEADRIGRMMNRTTGGLWQAEKDGCRNVKLFYNPRWMFQPRPQGVERIFVGIHPAGDPANPRQDNPCGDMLEYLDDPKSGRPHNQWIDGRWAGNGKTHQILVRKVFDALSDDGDGECALRATPSFNVCPLRTRGYTEVDGDVWDASVRLYKRIVKKLRPKTIICNGTGKRTPWEALNPNRVRCWRIGTASPKLRFGFVQRDDGCETRVIGIPHLTGQAPYDREALMDLLKELRETLIGHETSYAFNG